jgi:hypothetical protein
MIMDKEKITGLTKDSGFQLGVRKTIEGNQVDVWNFLISSQGIRLWLGPIEPERLAPRKPFSLNNGVEGEITVLKLQSHLRMKWKKKSWKNISRLQLRVIPYGRDKTTISFHQEKLSDPEQRETMKKHWKKVVSELGDKLQFHI